MDIVDALAVVLDLADSVDAEVDDKHQRRRQTVAINTVFDIMTGLKSGKLRLMEKLEKGGGKRSLIKSTKK
jgi:hypothetical protein